MNSVIKDVELMIREGTVQDIPLLLEFIRSMAAFENLSVAATEESLRNALFGEQPSGSFLLVFSGGKPIGYVTYFFTFSSMLGKRGLWLDDLFLDAGYRGQGIGKAIMAHLAQIALDHDCGRFEWMVLDWNEAAIGFYEKLGAHVFKEWRVCRVDEERIESVADRIT